MRRGTKEQEEWAPELKNKLLINYPMTFLKLDHNGSQQLIRSHGEKTEKGRENSSVRKTTRKLKNVKNKGVEQQHVHITHKYKLQQ